MNEIANKKNYHSQLSLANLAVIHAAHKQPARPLHRSIILTPSPPIITPLPVLILQINLLLLHPPTVRIARIKVGIVVYQGDPVGADPGGGDGVPLDVVHLHAAVIGGTPVAAVSEGVYFAWWGMCERKERARSDRVGLQTMREMRVKPTIHVVVPVRLDVKYFVAP